MMRLIMTAALAAFASAQCDLTPGTDCSSDTCTYTAAVTGSAATADSCDSPSAVVAAYTPTCDLDAATDDTDACPTGCTDVAEVSEVAGPACEFTGDVCPAGCATTAAVEDDPATTDADETEAATCTGTSTPTTAYSAADCTGTADEVAEVAEVAGPACEFTGDVCPAGCTNTPAATFVAGQAEVTAVDEACAVTPVEETTTETTTAESTPTPPASGASAVTVGALTICATVAALL